MYSWEVHSQNSSPEVLNFTGTAPVKYYCSIQTFIVFKRGSPSTGIQKLQNLTAWAEDFLGTASHTAWCQGTDQSSLPVRPAVPRRKDFQIAFVSGSSPRLYFPKEGLTGGFLGARIPSCTSAEVCGFIYVAFILCMKKHSSGIGFTYVRFLFLAFFFFFF